MCVCEEGREMREQWEEYQGVCICASVCLPVCKCLCVFYICVSASICARGVRACVHDGLPPVLQ